MRTAMATATFFQGIVPPNQAETTFPQRLGEVEADILTGSQPDGSAFQPDKDMTCKTLITPDPY